MAGEETTTTTDVNAAGGSAVTTPAVDPNDLSNPENFEKLPAHVKGYVAKLQLDKKQANDEAAARRAELRQTQSERDAAKKELDAKKTAELEEAGRFKELYEQEKAQKASLISESNKRLTRAEIRAHAINEGLIDPEIADLIPADKITIDASGNLTGVTEAIAAYKTAKPNLFTKQTQTTTTTPVARTTTADAGEPGAQNSGADASATEAARVRNMPKPEYEAYKKQQVLKLRK